MFEKDDGLERIVKNLPVLTIDPSEHGVEGFPKVSFFLESVHIGKPTMAAGIDGEVRMLPHTAREYGASYDAPLKLNLSLQIGDSGWQTLTRTSGRLPIMVRSGRCHLQGLTRAEMVKHREEAGEWGGYFILNGNERLVRLIVMPRRNHIFAMERSSFLKRGPEYTRFATSIRCVRLDQSASTVNVHYLETGCVNVRFSIRKQEFFIPAVLILKALTGMTDREIYERITQNDAVASFVAERAELMIREAKPLKLKSRADVLAYLGRHFRMLLRAERTDSDVKVGEDLLREYLFIHVQDFVAPGPNGEAVSELAINAAKAELLIVMMQRLFLLVQEKIKPDNVDAMSAHEALLPGYLYAMILKEALYDWLHGVRGSIIRDIRRQPKKVRLADTAYWRKTCDMVPEIGRKIKYFLVTGNLVSKTGLDLMQVSGYTISAEKLNYYRYLSHFRSVHRGQFFTTMKTTAVRKLLPESWGFMCPVHTPDGSPCGLLNHMSASCAILTRPCPIPSTELVNVLFLLGMSEVRTLPNPALIPVFLDGIVVGRVAATEAQTFCAKLRYLKITNSPAVYEYLEIFLVSDLDDKMWPAVCLSTAAARFVRPVYYLPTTQVPKPVVEYIGAMEQLTMEIACTAEDFMPGMTTHQEITPTNILSVIASLTPFSDHNQSPRNMYQCQVSLSLHHKRQTLFPILFLGLHSTIFFLSLFCLVVRLCACMLVCLYVVNQPIHSSAPQCSGPIALHIGLGQARARSLFHISTPSFLVLVSTQHSYRLVVCFASYVIFRTLAIFLPSFLFASLFFRRWVSKRWARRSIRTHSVSTTRSTAFRTPRSPSFVTKVLSKSTSSTSTPWAVTQSLLSFPTPVTIWKMP